MKTNIICCGILLSYLFLNVKCKTTEGAYGRASMPNWEEANKILKNWKPFRLNESFDYNFQDSSVNKKQITDYLRKSSICSKLRIKLAVLTGRFFNDNFKSKNTGVISDKIFSCAFDSCIGRLNEGDCKAEFAVLSDTSELSATDSNIPFLARLLLQSDNKITNKFGIPYIYRFMTLINASVSLKQFSSNKYKIEILLNPVFYVQKKDKQFGNWVPMNSNEFDPQKFKYFKQKFEQELKAKCIDLANNF